MFALHPRSLLFLLLMGCGSLTLPLGFGLHRAGGFVSKIGQDAESLVHLGMITTRHTRLMVSMAGDLVRNARQIQVLKDPALVAIYHERHNKLLFELAAIRTTNPSGPIFDASEELRRLANELDRIIADPTLAVVPLEEYLPRFEKLLSQARNVDSLSARRFDDELQSLGETTNAARQALNVQSLALIPITLLVALAFSAMVMRPIRALTRSIRSLGEGRLSGRVIIPGPRELASLGNELEWLRARLAESEEEKHGFLRRMSHELKTPLASLREGTELLADGSLGVLQTNQHEVVSIMRANASKLDMQINNLLTITASSATAPIPNIQALRVDHILTQVLRSHHLEITSKRIEVNARLDDVTVNFDPQQLRMALDNVIGNAVKFTPAAGAIDVGLCRSRGRALIDIIDSGPGIPAAERELVFRPFFQGSAATNSPLRGTGVGLSVVSDCLQRHGGRIRILAPKTCGAHVQISLPGARHVL